VSYGSHQETAARALAELVTNSARIEPSETEVVLQCRRQILLTLGERLQHLGYRPRQARPSRAVTVAQVVDRPLWQLGNLLLEQLPCPRLLPDLAPSDILCTDSATDSSLLLAWRSAARQLFLATSELQRAEHQPWLVRPAAGWYAIADLADCVAAVVAIDAGLDGAGVLASQPEVRGETPDRDGRQSPCAALGNGFGSGRRRFDGTGSRVRRRRGHHPDSNRCRHLAGAAMPDGHGATDSSER